MGCWICRPETFEENLPLHLHGYSCGHGYSLKLELTLAVANHRNFIVLCFYQGTLLRRTKELFFFFFGTK